MELTVEKIREDHKYNLQVGGWSPPDVITFLLAQLDAKELEMAERCEKIAKNLLYPR